MVTKWLISIGKSKRIVYSGGRHSYFIGASERARACVKCRRINVRKIYVIRTWNRFFKYVYILGVRPLSKKLWCWSKAEPHRGIGTHARTHSRTHGIAVCLRKLFLFSVRRVYKFCRPNWLKNQQQFGRTRWTSFHGAGQCFLDPFAASLRRECGSWGPPPPPALSFRQTF